MIVPMKKITVLTLDRHRDETLRTLRLLGVIHPEPIRKPGGETVESLRHAHQAMALIVSHIEQRAAIIHETGSPMHDSSAIHDQPDGPENPADQIGRWLSEFKKTAERLDVVAHDIHETEPLGDFDPRDLHELERKGIPIRLFRRPGKDPITAPPDTFLLVLHQDRTQRIFAVVGPYDQMPADRPVSLPSRSLSAMRKEQSDLQRRLSELDRHLNDAIRLLPQLRARLAEQSDALRLAETGAGMGEHETIVYLRGYCPEEHAGALQNAARKHGWAVLLEDPAADDNVPTLIRHPAWVRPIRSVLNLMGILPGYREVDVSAAFLLFFSLFFAMIVGDAGYGAIFLGLTLLAKRRWGRLAPPEPFRLMTVLSIATIVWGLLSGNIFGTTWFPTLVPWLDNRENLMMLCFLIGAIHLSVAHGWNAITIMNTPQALAQVGWIALTWTMFLTARSLILGADFPGWAYILLGAGLILVIVFMTPRRSFKTEWVSHAMLPLTIINNFVDVVSYVRLFAVGYATLAVAQAFNSMAIVDGMGVGRSLLAALILFAGHALNIVLCALSVLVHGIRLNTLEFSGHIDMQWTGFAYHPFAAEAGVKDGDQ